MKTPGAHTMKRIYIMLTALLLVNGLAAAEVQCQFQLSSNSVGLHEGISVTGEATGTGFDSDTKVEVNCNAANAEPYIGLPTTATTSAYTASYYPFRARCGYLAVGQDTIYEVSATLMPQNIACTSIGSNAVTIRASGTSAKTSPASASNAITNPAVPSTGRYGIIGTPETVQAALPAPVSTCGDLNQIPCEKKTNNWMFPVIYVCNAPYANNGEYPREKARCVACSPGTRYDGGRCVIDYGKPTPPAATPVPTARPTAAPTPAPSIVPVVTPNPTPPGPSVSAQTQPPINGDEARYVYKFRKGWNTFGLPWSYGDGSYGCSNGPSQLRYYSYNKASQSYESVTSLNPNNLRGTGIVAYAAVDCDYSIGQPRLTQDQFLTLFKGWNLISVQTSAFSGSGYGFNLKNECTITGGPWRYDNEKKEYMRDSVLKPGYAYWIEVKNPFCDIKVLGENQPPSFP